MDGISHNHRVIVSLVSRRDRPFQRGPYLCRYDGTSFRFYRDGGDDCGVFIVDLFIPAVGCWPTDIGEPARRQATGQLEGNANTPFGIKHAVIVVVIV